MNVKFPARFSLSTLFIVVLLLSMVLATVRVGGWVAVWILVGLYCLYSVVRILSRRTRICLLIVATYFASMPWIGTHRALGYPEHAELVTLEDSLRDSPIAIDVIEFVAIPYPIAELPLHFVEPFDADDLMFFERAGQIRPCFVFLFWTLVGLTVALAGLAAKRAFPKPASKTP